MPGLRPNANVLAGVASLDGYDGGVQVTRRWLSLVAREQGPVVLRPTAAQPVAPPALDASILARMNVRWVVLAIDRDRLGHVAGWARRS